MARINEMSDAEIQYGIMRCNARLAGIMPMGLMTAMLVKKALEEYVNELNIRLK